MLVLDTWVLKLHLGAGMQRDVEVICFYGVDEKLAGQLNFLAKAALRSLLLLSLLNFDPILQEKESLWYQNKKKGQETQTIPPPKFYRTTHCNVTLEEVGSLKKV